MIGVCVYGFPQRTCGNHLINNNIHGLKSVSSTKDQNITADNDSLHPNIPSKILSGSQKLKLETISSLVEQ